MQLAAALSVSGKWRVITHIWTLITTTFRSYLNTYILPFPRRGCLRHRSVLVFFELGSRNWYFADSCHLLLLPEAFFRFCEIRQGWLVSLLCKVKQQNRKMHHAKSSYLPSSKSVPGSTRCWLRYRGRSKTRSTRPLRQSPPRRPGVGLLRDLLARCAAYCHGHSETEQASTASPEAQEVLEGR